MQLSSDLPARSEVEAARLLALQLLEQAREGIERLVQGDDPTALHDFRVAIRRLRSHLRSWREQLKGSVRKRDRRALCELQEATGGGRDAEVALTWLEGQRGRHKPAQRFGLELAVSRLLERRSALDQQAALRLRRAFGELDQTLGDSLARLRLKLRLDRPVPARTWAEALAAHAESQVEELVARLGAVRSADEAERLHAARIAGKRLRYLLEPARGWSGAVRELLVRLKGLQDLLGEVHDSHVLASELEEARGQADRDHQELLGALAGPEDAPRLRARMRESPRPGLIELSRGNRQRLEQLFERLREEWLAGGLSTLRSGVLAFAADFARAGEPGGERRRRYLLHALPELPAGAESLELEQGWLPGDKLRERLSHARGPRGERWERALEVGAGEGCIEVGEELPPSFFAALWPLTEGTRIRTRRHRLRAGAHAWSIDEFLDRELVLAEVELLHAGERPELPEWLAPHLVREVTAEPGFSDLDLARGETRARA